MVLIYLDVEMMATVQDTQFLSIDILIQTNHT